MSSNNRTNDGAGAARSSALAVREEGTGSGSGPMSLVPSREVLNNLGRTGKMFAMSGFFKDAKGEAQCAVKILAGAELGLPAVTSMRSVHVFDGQVTLSATLMGALIKRSKPRYDWRIRKHDASVCEIAFFEDGEEVGTSVYTIEEAKAANLLGKQNWKVAPKNMLFARAMSNGAKWFCAELFNGQIYTPDELGANVDTDGNVIDVTPTPAPTAPSPSVSTPTHVSSSSNSVVPDGIVDPSTGEVIDWSPIGPMPGDGDDVTASAALDDAPKPEEEAVDPEAEYKAREEQRDRIQSQVRRLKLKQDQVERLCRVVFHSSDLTNATLVQMKSLADDLEQCGGIQEVLKYIREFEEGVKRRNAKSVSGEEPDELF